MSDYFKRIKGNQPLDTEEIRRDLCVPSPSGISYHGLATAGTSTSDASWSIIKITNDSSGNPTREQLFVDVAWDDRGDL